MWNYTRKMRFMIGKIKSTKGPGLIVLVPFIDKVERVDLRVLTINVDKQEAITKDNVTLNVDAITFFRVVDAEKAVIQVERYEIGRASCRERVEISWVAEADKKTKVME